MSFLIVLSTLLALSAGLSINSRTTGACHSSPCGEGAICEVRGGLTVCRCPDGVSGDPFSRCLASPTPPPLQSPSVKEGVSSTGGLQSTHYFIQTTETLANGGGFEVDFSRVPMRGEPTPASGDSGRSPLREGVAVETTGNVFLSPQRRPEPSGGNRRQPGPLLPQASFVPTEDPLGVFQRCRAVNGIVVCADHSESNNLGQTNFNIPMREEAVAAPPPHRWEETRPAGPPRGSSSSRVPPPSSSGSSSDLCKTMCGVNSVCRLVLERPVCGCPEGTSGDPSVSCDRMESGGVGGMAPPSGDMCSRHTECQESEICVRGECSDPCKSTADAGGMCGENSKCVVVQHTPLCACRDGFTGNPYQRCSPQV